MTEEEILEAVLNGKIRIRRFNAEEQIRSSNPSDRFLWLSLIRAESELACGDGRNMRKGEDKEACTQTRPFRFLEELSEPFPSSFSELVEEIGRYADRGHESAVFDGGDGFVSKIRPMIPSIMSGYLAPLANIVYHNRIFPGDRYTLETIYSDGEKYYMVLRQERVEIRLDCNDYPVKPSPDQIRQAIYALEVGLSEYSGGIIDDENGSTETDDEENGEHLRFFNSDYFISDFQPGRNTVIDDLTGRVRFIDPRITLNDPNGPITHVSKFGKRWEALPGQLLEMI